MLAGGRRDNRSFGLLPLLLIGGGLLLAVVVGAGLIGYDATRSADRAAVTPPTPDAGSEKQRTAE